MQGQSDNRLTKIDPGLYPRVPFPTINRNTDRPPFGFLLKNTSFFDKAQDSRTMAVCQMS